MGAGSNSYLYKVIRCACWCLSLGLSNCLVLPSAGLSEPGGFDLNYYNFPRHPRYQGFVHDDVYVPGGRMRDNDQSGSIHPEDCRNPNDQGLCPNRYPRNQGTGGSGTNQRLNEIERKLAELEKRKRVRISIAKKREELMRKLGLTLPEDLTEPDEYFGSDDQFAKGEDQQLKPGFRASAAPNPGKGRFRARAANISNQAISLSVAKLKGHAEKLERIKGKAKGLHKQLERATAYQAEILTAAIKNKASLKERDFEYQTGTKEQFLAGADKMKAELLHEALNYQTASENSLIGMVEAKNEIAFLENHLRTKFFEIGGDAKSDEEFYEWLQSNEDDLSSRLKQLNEELSESGKLLASYRQNSESKAAAANTDQPLSETELKSQLAAIRKEQVDLQTLMQRYDSFLATANVASALPAKVESSISNLAAVNAPTEEGLNDQSNGGADGFGMHPVGGTANTTSSGTIDPSRNTASDEPASKQATTDKKKPQFYDRDEPHLQIEDKPNESMLVELLETDKPEIFFQISFKYRKLHRHGRFDEF